ncbi:2-oxoglutarate (2OG) and Fe(II)-dependent oxygenase superfamily protein [Striga asiatica]|uniref:2-oxoglutarate (2OG) and Fe(II)-dependent oxygenase superfamily protein n=1 Tax=Striga asiatica TaxID=4170 RepID=A0A5A7R4H0_STRAF|nr:2-oxoglutarate (2OG) and Fe(II)-dependent oxygenase superfamily protein [Striga asiatica]
MATEKEARMRMLKEFDETNAGVKGLVDLGLQKIPEIFVSPLDEFGREPELRQSVQVPVIDIGDMGNPERRNWIVEQVRMASEAFGFFQVVNHGIPRAVLDGMIGGVHGFMDLDVQEKRKYYTRDVRRAVRYTSSYDLYTARTASWRDTLSVLCLGPDPIDPDELPGCSRCEVENDIVGSLTNSVMLEKKNSILPVRHYIYRLVE